MSLSEGGRSVSGIDRVGSGGFEAGVYEIGVLRHKFRDAKSLQNCGNGQNRREMGRSVGGVRERKRGRERGAWEQKK
jgi:hypothetical protein